MNMPQPQNQAVDQAAFLKGNETETRPLRALVLSGGVALGAFEAGAYAALEEAGSTTPDWLIGASVGAVNAALIAGNPPKRRVERLREFWKAIASDPTPATTFLLGPPPPTGAWRQAYNEASALQTILFGRPGLFRPRLMLGAQIGEAPALYDLEPLQRRLLEMVDFGQLNSGDIRLSVITTDVVSGERIVFDTGRGVRIGPEHLVASCALLPLFAPVEVKGRLLADGGLASNLALDLVLDEPRTGPLECFAVELFARAGSRPQSLGASIARAGDLAFGNQTRRIIEGRAREHRLRALLDRLAARLPPELHEDAEVASLLAEAGSREGNVTLLLLGYHAAADEAGPGKVFDFSHSTLADRWEAGAHCMQEALRRLRLPESAATLAPGLLLHEVVG
jgi:NTE family protein